MRTGNSRSPWIHELHQRDVKRRRDVRPKFRSGASRSHRRPPKNGTGGIEADARDEVLARPGGVPAGLAGERTSRKLGPKLPIEELSWV